MDLLLQQTVNAFALGGTYALLALGLAVVFSIMGLINFAHGELMTIAGYVLMYCGIAGVPFVLAVALAILVAMAAAVLMERIAFRPVRNASGATMLITSFAVAMVLQVLFQNLISARSQAVLLPALLSDSVRVGGFVIGVNKILAILATAVMLVFLDWFMKHQKTGIAMRAAAEDFAVARLMGIRANTVIAGAFALSGLLAGAAAVLWVSQRASVDPLMGFTPVLKAFIAAILGGLGSLRGAVAGGFLLGFIEIYLAAFLPPDWQEFRDPIGLAPSARAARVVAIFDPFQAEVGRWLARRRIRATFSIHSFTPRMAGIDRLWDIGFLFRADRATSAALSGHLAAHHPGLAIGMNQPYQIDDASDWFVPRHGEARGLPHSLIEIRNDHIRRPEGQALWADWLAGAIRAFIKDHLP